MSVVSVTNMRYAHILFMRLHTYQRYIHSGSQSSVMEEAGPLPMTLQLVARLLVTLR